MPDFSFPFGARVPVTNRAGTRVKALFVDARSPAAKSAGVRKAEFDSAGNIVRAQTIPHVRPDGTPVAGGVNVEAPKSSALDDHLNGLSTPRLNSAFSNSPAPAAATVAPGSNDPRLGGSASISPAESAVRRNVPASWAAMTFQQKSQAARDMRDPATAAGMTAAANIDREQMGAFRGRRATSSPMPRPDASVPGGYAVSLAGRAAAATPGTTQTASTPWGTVSVRRGDRVASR